MDQKLFVRILLSPFFDSERRKYANVTRRKYWLQLNTSEIATIGDLICHIKETFAIVHDLILFSSDKYMLERGMDLSILRDTRFNQPILVQPAPRNIGNEILQTEYSSSHETPNNEVFTGATTSTTNFDGSNTQDQEDYSCVVKDIDEDSGMSDSGEDAETSTDDMSLEVSSFVQSGEHGLPQGSALAMRWEERESWISIQDNINANDSVLQFESLDGKESMILVESVKTEEDREKVAEKRKKSHIEGYTQETEECPRKIMKVDSNASVIENPFSTTPEKANQCPPSCFEVKYLTTEVPQFYTSLPFQKRQKMQHLWNPEVINHLANFAQTLSISNPNFR